MIAKRRKILPAFLLALVMVLSTACSSSEKTQPSDGSSSVAEDDGESSSVEQIPGGEITIAETVLYEAEGVTITATGYEESWSGPQIKIVVENDTKQNLLVTVQSLSVNGYMMPTASLYAQVAAGKKTNDAISLLSSELEQAGIDTIANLQFYLKIADSDSYDTLISSDLITLDTSASGYQQPVDDSGEVLYEENGIRIISRGLQQSPIWDGTFVFLMENNSGEPITVSAENVSVNGFMEDVSLWSELRDGTRLIDGMYLLDLSDLGLESIEDVESIELNFRIIHSDTWDEIVTTDVISLSFE